MREFCEAEVEEPMQGLGGGGDNIELGGGGAVHKLYESVMRRQRLCQRRMKVETLCKASGGKHTQNRDGEEGDAMSI